MCDISAFLEAFNGWFVLEIKSDKMHCVTVNMATVCCILYLIVHFQMLHHVNNMFSSESASTYMEGSMWVCSLRVMKI